MFSFSSTSVLSADGGVFDHSGADAMSGKMARAETMFGKNFGDGAMNMRWPVRHRASFCAGCFEWLAK